jgi:hypothetical protein
MLIAAAEVGAGAIGLPATVGGEGQRQDAAAVVGERA